MDLISYLNIKFKFKFIYEFLYRDIDWCRSKKKINKNIIIYSTFYIKNQININLHINIAIIMFIKGNLKIP